MMRSAFLLALLCGLAALCLWRAGVAEPLTAKNIPAEAPTVCGFAQGEMAPLQPLVELLGATMTKDAGVITVTRQGKTCILTVGKTEAQDNGQAVTLPAPPLAVGESLFVPLQPLAKALGLTCMVNKASGVVNLKYETGTLVLPYESMVTADGGKTKPLAASDYRDCEEQLFVMNADGSEVHRLTYRVFGVRLPDFSADGQKWAYLRSPLFFPLGSVFAREAGSPISTCLRMSDSAGGVHFCQDAAISPDGATVLYSEASQVPEGAEGDPSCNIFSIPFSGGTPKKLVQGISPSFSPDGHTVVFSGFDMAKKESVVTLMDPDGKNQRVIGQGDMAQFSPDGTYLLFYRSYVKGEDPQQCITTCKLAAKMRDVKVYEAPKDQRDTDELDAVFTPDSQHILFVRKDKGLWMMNPDRGKPRQLTTGTTDHNPTCLPDGKHVLFLRDNHLYQMTINGTDITPLLANLDIHAAKPSPDGKLIFFLVQPQGTGE